MTLSLAAMMLVTEMAALVPSKFEIVTFIVLPTEHMQTETELFFFSFFFTVAYHLCYLQFSSF